jgi:diaminopimelate epimerase
MSAGVAGAFAGLPFTKMAGGGNDFIVIDARDARPIADLHGFVRDVCRRGLSVGADGVLLVDRSAGDPIVLAHYNADGGRSRLCGNGTRCAARWARLRHGGAEALRVRTDAGEVLARFPERRGRVELRLGFGCAAPEARRLDLDGRPVEGHFVEVGIPHFLVEVPDVARAPVASLGPWLRRHPAFGPAGTNVSFVARRPDGSIDIRTFERGVEAETLSCGTGCVAAGVLAVHRGWRRGPVVCRTRSGVDLVVGATAGEGGTYADLRLEGDARVIYEGRLSADAIGSHA